MKEKIINHLARHAVWYGAGLTVLYFAFWMVPTRGKPGEFNYRDFGRLPVYDGGRYKPMDTVARSNLMVLTHRQQFYDASAKKTYPATKWLLDVYTTPLPQDKDIRRLLPNNKGVAWNEKVFRIENDQVIAMLGLKMVEGLRYSFFEIAPGIPQLFEEAARLVGDDERDIRGIDPKQWSLKDGKVVELANHVRLFMRLAGHGTPLLIPSADGTEKWQPFRDYLYEAKSAGQIGAGADGKAFDTYANLFKHYQNGEVHEFNKLLSKYLGDLEKDPAARVSMLNAEIFFNEFAPFYRCLEVYVVLALVIALSWLAPTYSVPLRKAAFASMIVVFLFHTFALGMRCWLQGRPPVTNLYSSAVFIGWGCVLFCLIVERFYNNGIAVEVGSVTGFCTLIIAHILSLDGDTMVMMQAVLDTNFWLATHVTCVTLGYTSAFVAGFMGMAYILLGFFTNMLRKDGSANLARMTYGVLCAGMFLSFVGTVLGGLWADYSWGRFWGWDPKENGALLIVIWIALILHARWGGLVKQRGIAVLAVLGNIVTSWSWFGTNFLGVGLHAYGGAKGDAMLAMNLINLLFLGIAALGCVPLESWQSFRPLSSLPPTQPPPGPESKTGITAKPKMV